MKTLALGVVLILLLGVGGFVYRHVMETTAPPTQVACTMDAKVCPDGSGVGRVAPLCEFAPCPLPNAEDSDAKIAFVIPAGYEADPTPIGADLRLRSVFIKPSLTENLPHTISIKRFAIPEGQTGEEVILQNVRLQPSDLPVESMEEFSPVVIQGKTFQGVVIERFEAQVHSAYFLIREADVLMFEVMERDVVDWMEPTLVEENLPEHQALLALLASLQSF